jgi:SpoVK/Ycf46/Vps4 family AAA+-type ATPase
VECIAGRRSETGGGGDEASSADLAVDRLLSLLLVEMDGALTPQQTGTHASSCGVVVVATTHDAALVEPALLRAGRLDQHVPLGLLDAPKRQDALRQLLRHTPLADDLAGGRGRAALVASLALQSGGFSGADLERLCQEAALAALRRCLHAEQGAWAHATVSEQDFQHALTACGHQSPPDAPCGFTPAARGKRVPLAFS